VLFKQFLGIWFLGILFLKLSTLKHFRLFFCLKKMGGLLLFLGLVLVLVLFLFWFCVVGEYM